MENCGTDPQRKCDLAWRGSGWWGLPNRPLHLTGGARRPYRYHHSLCPADLRSPKDLEETESVWGERPARFPSVAPQAGVRLRRRLPEGEWSG